MIIIGERINASRPAIQKAIEESDEALIQKEARSQAERGAQYLDINCGLSRDKEERDMVWLVSAVRKVCDIPLCIDSPNSAAIEKGVAAAGANCLINSITLEESRYKKIIPIALRYKCGIIALTMDSRGMPNTAAERAGLAEQMYKIMKAEGLSDEKIFFDPLVRPIASEPGQAKELLLSIPLIKRLGDVKVICGVSNVSYGLPKRKLINSIFLSLAIAAGLDGAITDPTDESALGAILGAEAIMGKDKYCMNLIKSHRKGLI